MEYLHADKKAVLAISDIENEQLHKLPEASKGRAWVEPIFSPKGDRIVFVDRDVESPSSRIATIERDGGNFRHFEETANADYPKISHPSLSPNEDTLLFVRSVDLPGEGEIFERDIASGAEIQLTELRFFIVRRLRYLPDGRNFTFSGKTPLVSGQDPRFRGNHIYLMGPDRGYELKPAFVQGNSSSVPSMSADGKKILFRSRTNNLDGIEHAPPNMDLFVRSDGENHRITKLGLSIQSAVLSPDGETVFFVADKARAMNWAPTNKKHVYGFWLMNSDGTNMREIRFPDQPETPVP